MKQTLSSEVEKEERFSILPQGNNEVRDRIITITIRSIGRGK